MKIGVISDTHGDVEATQRALRILDSLNVSLTIHCGDVGEEILPLLAGRRFHFVCGNMDARDPLAQQITDPEHTFHDQFGTLEIEGCRVAFLHGHDVKLLQHSIHSGHWDLLCHGHTHAYSKSREGRTVALNPGALSRTRCPSLAVVELPSLEVMQIPL
jgi:putative phosphoesterase